MIIGAFGLPRSGKTTYLAKIAYNERIKIFKGISNYERIISTAPLWGAELVTREDIINCRWYNTLILIDEISLFFGNREFKTFGREATEVFAMHGHFGNQIYWASQKVDDVDCKIWALTDRLYYIKKGFLFRGITHLYGCPHVVTFDEQSKRPIQGFDKPGFLSKIVHQRLHRRIYYSLFDTHFRYEDYDKKPLKGRFVSLGLGI